MLSTSRLKSFFYNVTNPQYRLFFGRQVVFDSLSVNQDHPNLSLRDETQLQSRVIFVA
jgi:hypothetical protein